MQGILWAVLKRELGVKRIYPVGRPHHCTLQFGVEREQWEKWIGHEFTATLTEMCWNERIMAARVALPPEIKAICQNAHPHISVCWVDGATPVESNGMLSDPLMSHSMSEVVKFEVKFHAFK